MPLIRVVQQLWSLYMWTSRSDSRQAAPAPGDLKHASGANGCRPQLKYVQDVSSRAPDFDDMLRLDPRLLRDIGISRCDLLHCAWARHWGYANHEAASTLHPAAPANHGRGPAARTETDASARARRIARIDVARPG